MGRNALLALLLLSLIVFDGSDASLVWELRKLVALDSKDNGTAIHDSRSPNPAPDPKPVDTKEKKKKDPPSTNTTRKVDPKGSGNAISPASAPLSKWGGEKVDTNVSSNTIPASSPLPVTKRDGEKSTEEEKKKNKGKAFSQSDTSENCDGLKTCTDQGDMVACISETENGSKYLVVLVQNGGDSDNKVKLFMNGDLGDIEVAKHRTKMINISLTSSENTQLTLNAGKGECVLHLGSKGSIFVRLPSYNKILTPVNGSYFLILTAVVFGGTWACCKLRKKQNDRGIPYQELEMALPESVSAANAETAEGWDQGWDDDWDEDVAVKSSAVHPSGSISANGLTSRSSNREGWEDNWDD